MANYEITIKTDRVSGGNSAISGANSDSDTAQGNGLLSKEGAKAFATGMVAYRTVKSFATQIINHEVSLVELRTGSRELQQRTSFYNEIAQKGVGILEKMAFGAFVGGGVGAFIGLTLGTTHELIGYAQNQQRIDTERNIENQSLQMQYIRAGAGGSRRNE